MPNVKVQGSNEVQRPNKKKNEEEWNEGTLEYRIEQNNPWILLHYSGIILSNFSHFGRKVPRKPRLVGGVKGHNMNETSFARIWLATACPGSPALWAGSFTFI